MTPVRTCRFLTLFAAWVSVLGAARGVAAQAVDTRADSVSIRFVDTELRTVVQALGRYLDKPVLTQALPAVRITLETPGLVPRAQVLPLLQGLAATNNLDLVEDSAYFRLGPHVAPPPPITSVPAAAEGAIRLHVIRLKHARAADVAATVNLLFGGGGGSGDTRPLTGGTLSDELRRNRVPVAGAPAPPAPADRAQASASFAGEVTIVPDELTNALLVRASTADFNLLTDAVAELDVRPLQVLIEILIVEARRDRTFSLGTSIFVPQQRAAGGSIGGSTAAVGLGDVVLQLMHLGKADIDATLSASEARGDVRIVSRPVLLASNNTEARLLVGSQRPFVQVSRSLPTDTPSRDQVVQYRDVGTRLTVRPTINQDGYVSLAVQQEINAATSEVAFDAPVISTREAVTQVLVRDGQTIMLGGLRDQQRERSSSGIPVLSGLPLIGGLFGTTGRRASDTELYLFLTPRILKSDEDADTVTAPRLRRSGQPGSLP